MNRAGTQVPEARPGGRLPHAVLRTSSRIPSGEIAIFEPSEEPIDFVAEGKAGFVLGSAAKHPHALVLGNYSVHTSAQALREGGGDPSHRSAAPRRRDDFNRAADRR